MTYGEHLKKTKKKVEFITFRIPLENIKLLNSAALHANLIDKYIRILQQQTQYLIKGNINF